MFSLAVLSYGRLAIDRGALVARSTGGRLNASGVARTALRLIAAKHTLPTTQLRHLGRAGGDWSALLSSEHSVVASCDG